jgi:hypothetical protein
MLQAVAEAIARMEGFYVAGSLAQRNNNPGNLMYAGQAGAVPAPATFGTFAKFSTVELGWQALYRQIQLDARRGLTLQQFFQKYAPAGHGGNDPAGYAQFVAARVGAKVSDPLASVIAGTPAPMTGGGGSTAIAAAGSPSFQSGQVITAPAAPGPSSISPAAADPAAVVSWDLMPEPLRRLLLAFYSSQSSAEAIAARPAIARALQCS